jgi:hypothetical protein
MRFWATTILVLLLPIIALAQDKPDPEDPGSLVTWMINAVKGGEWQAFVALCIMLVVWIVQRTPLLQIILDKHPQARIWAALVIGVFGACATNYFVHGDWVSAIMSGITVGAAAGGFWTALGKQVLGPKYNKAVEDKKKDDNQLEAEEK